LPNGDQFLGEIASSELDFHPSGPAGRFMAFNRWQGQLALIDPMGFDLGETAAER
jgi:hypothetical protein